VTKAELSFAGALRLGSTTVPYTVRQQDRADLSISVLPDLRLEVLAPRGRPRSEIEAKLMARSAWILRQQHRFRDLHPLPQPKRYVSGETFRYLGRQYRLRVLRAEHRRVVLRRPLLVVETSDTPTQPSVKRLVCNWYRARATIMLPKYVEQVQARYPALRSLTKDVRICQMKTRWGSCTASGLISLHPDLVQAGPACIEYVLVHELCHRHVMNHGPRFRRLMDQLMPNWRDRRADLSRITVQ